MEIMAACSDDLKLVSELSTCTDRSSSSSQESSTDEPSSPRRPPPKETPSKAGSPPEPKEIESKAGYPSSEVEDGPPRKPPPPERYVVFRGNGASYLRAAFARRAPRWRAASAADSASAEDRCRPTSNRAADSKVEQILAGFSPAARENLLLTKALIDGNVAFVFRDLLCGPHWVDSPMATGQKPPTESLHSRQYASVTSSKKVQIVNRWPRMSSLTSKDGSLKSLEAYYRSQALSPWRCTSAAASGQLASTP